MILLLAAFPSARAGTCQLTAGDAPFAEIAVHERIACALDAGGHTACVDTTPCTRCFEHTQVEQLVARPVPCARRTDGQVICEDLAADRRQVDPGWDDVPPIRASLLASTHQYACLQPVDGAAPVCWGNVHGGNVPAPAGEGWTSLRAGVDGLCASRPGETRCWPRAARLDVARPEVHPAEGRYQAIGVIDGVAMAFGPDVPVRLGPAREVATSAHRLCWTGAEGTRCEGLNSQDEPPPEVAAVQPVPSQRPDLRARRGRAGAVHWQRGPGARGDAGAGGCGRPGAPARSGDAAPQPRPGLAVRPARP